MNSIEMTDDLGDGSIVCGDQSSSAKTAAGVPCLQVTIVHSGNSHTISKDDQYEYQYKSATGDVTTLPFNNYDDDVIEVFDGSSSFTLKRSMVYDYRKQANYFGPLKVFRERKKVLRNGKEEMVIRTSLVQVKVTAKGKDGKHLGPNELNPAVSRTPGIIPAIDEDEVRNYKQPSQSNMVPITFGNHIVDINKNAIDQFKKLSGVNRTLKAQLSKLYKCKNGVDVPITVLKLFAPPRKGDTSMLLGGPSEISVTNKWSSSAVSSTRAVGGGSSAISSTSGGFQRVSASPDTTGTDNFEDLKHFLTTKCTEVPSELAQLGRVWCRNKPRDLVDGGPLHPLDAAYAPPDLSVVLDAESIWHYLVHYSKQMENLIDFEYEINEDRWLELKRASNTFHVNGEMWPDVVIKVVYRINKITKVREVVYFIRVLSRLIKTGLLVRGTDVDNLVQSLNPDRKICVGFIATPYLQMIETNGEMRKLLKKEGVLVLHPFESDKCCGVVRDISQMYNNNFRRGVVSVEGEQVVCPPCHNYCTRLNQLFSATDPPLRSKPREQSSVVSSSGGMASVRAPTALAGIGSGSGVLRGSRVEELLTQSLDDVLRYQNTRRALLEEDARLGLPASKRVAIEIPAEGLDDHRPDVVLSQQEFLEMIDIRRPEVGGTKKTLYKSCSHCNYVAKSLLALFVHMKVHLGELTAVCNKCKAHFSDKDALEKHRIETHNQKFPECPVCFVEFTNNDQLFDHMNVHRSHHPFICLFCSDGFFTLEAYKKHLRTNHKIQRVNDLQISCRTCRVHFYTQDHLTLHRVNMNHNDFDLFTCKVCGYDFDTATSFREHIMEHSEEERDVANIAVCPTCYKVFFSAYRLQFHIDRMHISPKDKEVEQHSLETAPPLIKRSSKGSYMRYMKESEKNMCVLCNRRFKTEEILQSHIEFCHKVSKTDSSTKSLTGDTIQGAQFVSIPSTGSELNETAAVAASVVIGNNVVTVDGSQVMEVTGQGLMDSSGMIQVDADMMQVGNNLVQMANGEFVALSNSTILSPNTAAKLATTSAEDSIPVVSAGGVLLNTEFRCELCGRRFDTESALASHMKIHSGTRPVFQCEECGEIYSKKQQVLDHIRIDHADQVQQHASQVQQEQEHLQQEDDDALQEHSHDDEQQQAEHATDTTVTDAPLLHFVDQASEQQVEVQTAAQDDVMLQLPDF